MAAAADVNHTYFVWYVKRATAGRDLVVLDFGCGEGQLVRMLRDEGVRCLGADVFYEGGRFDELFRTDLFGNGVIRPIGEDGRVPFADASVDLIVSNQVFEHVEEIEPVVAELKRILESDGVMYHHFPSREMLREGHIGIPFAHRLPTGRARFAHTRARRRMGLGYHQDERSTAQWTQENLDWMDSYCFYRPYRRIRTIFASQFSIHHREIDYCRFRARGAASRLLAVRAVRTFADHAFRRLVSMAIELRPLASAREPPRGC